MSAAPPWHVRPPEEVLQQLEVSQGGLTSAEAGARLARFGPNALPEVAPPSFPVTFLRQFRSPLIYVLAAAGVVSTAIGEPGDAGFIFAVLLLNASIGSVQEWRAERSSRALQRLVRTRATVLRDGEAREVDGEQVVPGDIVWLESGNRVPADLRLLGAQGLEIDESLLTGESLPVLKDAGWSGPPLATVGDRRNMAHAGSVVIRGRGKGAVVETGRRTLVGQLAVDVAAAPGGKPPLLVRMERFARVIGFAVLAAALLVGLIGVLGRGHAPSEMFLFAVALAVSAIPEGLPVAMTVALAVATGRMARRGVIVRKLTAVEGLGSCTLIASDKTGTLTCNEITLRVVSLEDGATFDVTGEGYAPEGVVEAAGQRASLESHPPLTALARAAALCNEGHLHQRDGSWAWRGDPTDVALLSFAHKLGLVREDVLARWPQVNQIPFEPERKYAATYHRAGDAVRVFVKGAPERVLEMCAGSGRRPALLERAAELGARGFRVLALAEGEGPPAVEPGALPVEPSDLTFLGFVGMIDPLRPGVRDAVQACKAAGIGVTMITGDHPVTALAIARELGMAQEPHEVISGLDLAKEGPDGLAGLVGRARVFARVSPQQKLDIVNAARQAGHFVAVTGDGVNDAPALRAANIGVAMGKGGTDVAREAAELVLGDDNFATIVAGVEEGRVAYDNVRKVIYLLVSTGAAEVVMVTLSLAFGLPLPLLPVQLLWLNLVTNGIQDVALAFEPKEADVLRRRPRPPRERIFERLMIERTLLAAGVMGGVGFAAFHWMVTHGWSEPAARNMLLLLMVLFESLHIGNCRSETRSLFRLSPLTSPILLAGTLAAFLLHVGAMHLPFAQRLLQTDAVPLPHWLALIGLALTITVAMELHKLTWALRVKPRSAG